MRDAGKQRTKAAAAGPVALYIGTRKGAFILKGDAARKAWKLSGPFFLGNNVHHVLLDPRDRKTVLLAAKTGHLGPTVFRSRDGGRSFKEASLPPRFPKAPEGEKGRAVDHVFWLTPGPVEQPAVWWAGTSPQGLFKSSDGGDTWEGVAGFNEHPMREKWTGGAQDGTPDGPKMHSVIIDPRDPDHMYIGMSSGGVFESTDGGRDWRPLNKGCAADFHPDPDLEYGHDPHCVRIHPMNPDILYQQNHCGIYRMDRTAGVWDRIGRKMPKKIGDIGFPMVLHPRDPDTAWVFPMDGTEVWPRVSPGGKPASYVTRDAGRSWKRLDVGLPGEQAWWTVLRQAMTGDAHDPLGIYFGTTTGEIWASRNEGEKWSCIARHLPHVYSLEAADVGRG
jgi:hypothetical protein